MKSLFCLWRNCHLLEPDADILKYIKNINWKISVGQVAFVEAKVVSWCRASTWKVHAPFDSTDAASPAESFLFCSDLFVFFKFRIQQLQSLLSLEKLYCCNKMLQKNTVVLECLKPEWKLGITPSNSWLGIPKTKVAFLLWTLEVN